MRHRRIAAVAALVAASLALPVAARAYEWTRNLKQGDTGPDVKELQIRVAGWASDGAAQVFIKLDGSFGPATAAAVRRVQYAYRLPITGEVTPTVHSVLNALEDADGSTEHFNFGEFTSRDGVGFAGGKVGEAEVKENVRRTMYKLEALRKKLGDRSVTVNSGFRSVAYNTNLYGYATNSQHQYGIAADIVVSGRTTQQVYQVAETCGFSGLEAYTNSWQHVDSRMEYTYGAQYWWWESGTDALPGAFADPPKSSDVANLLQSAAGLRSSAGLSSWDIAPSPSTDPRGLGDGRIGLVDAVRAQRRMIGLETRWP